MADRISTRPFYKVWFSLRGFSGKSPETPPGIDPGTARLVAQCLNHYATPGPPSVIYCTSLEFTLRTFKSSYIFRSSDHLQGVYIVPS